MMVKLNGSNPAVHFIECAKFFTANKSRKYNSIKKKQLFKLRNKSLFKLELFKYVLSLKLFACFDLKKYFCLNKNKKLLF